MKIRDLCEAYHRRSFDAVARLATRSRGFSLLEVMVALALVLILAAIAIPGYEASHRKAREALLRDDLYTMRKMIDQFTKDNQRSPSSPDELVEEQYLPGGIPVDPVTHSAETWVWECEEEPLTPQQAGPGIVDVHSGSDEISSDGVTPYSSW